MKILLITGKAVSLRNVLKDIALVAMKHGHIARVVSHRPSTPDIPEICDATIFVYPASPLFCTPHFLAFRDLRKLYNIPSVFYTTVEGRPTRFHVKAWMMRDLDFVANSQYTAQRLMEAGLNVIDVIYHGLHEEYLKEARKMLDRMQMRLKRKHGDKVVFGVLAFWHKRKGLDLLAKAVQELSKKREDFVVHLMTNTMTMRKIGKIPNLYIEDVFGERMREEVLALLGALDYLIVPSLAEGFCLPLLEANAMGTPVIHCLYPPLTEISDLDHNITFDYDDVFFENLHEGIDYELHYYNPKALAEAMDYALDIRLNNEDEYMKRSKKVSKIARKFNAKKLYKRLIDILKKQG